MAQFNLTTLYYGDNGAHEFFEDTKKEWLILRNHSESWWSLFHKGLICCDNEGLIKCGTLLECIHAAENYEIQPTIIRTDTNHIWKMPTDKRKKEMELRFRKAVI